MSENSASEITIHRLDNGFTIVMEKLPYLHSVSMGVWIKAGSLMEEPEQAGIAHFLEHLFFKGTKKRNCHQIMEAIESRGGYLNAATSREYTTLYVRMLKEYVIKGIDILADILMNSTFKDVEKERGVILEEIAATEDMPDELVHDLLCEYHWPHHALGRPVSGYVNTVSGLKHDDFRRFFDQWYKPSNMVFSIVGNFNESVILKKLEAVFSKLPPGNAITEEAAPHFQGGVKMVERPISQTHIALAFPGVTTDDERLYMCNLLSGVLGGGGTSRLFEIIRERKGLAYSVYAYHSHYMPAGIFGIYEAVSPQNCARALDLTFRELRRLRDKAVSAAELERARQQIKGAMLMGFESTKVRMTRLAKNVLFRGRVIPVEELIASLDAVTREEIQEYARLCFNEDSCALMLLGPAETCVPEKIAL